MIGGALKFFLTEDDHHNGDHHTYHNEIRTGKRRSGVYDKRFERDTWAWITLHCPVCNKKCVQGYIKDLEHVYL